MSELEAVRAEIAKLLEECIRVIPRPPGGKGSDWWVGLELSGSRGRFNAFWDSSLFSRPNAEACAAACREIMAERIMGAIANAHVR